MDYKQKLEYQSNYWYNDGLKKAQIRDLSGAIVSLKRSLQFNRENITARNLLSVLLTPLPDRATPDSKVSLRCPFHSVHV